MSVRAVNCPDCNVPMEIGCQPDITHGGARWASFLPGVPAQETIFGLFKTGGMVVDWKRAIPVTVYRCPDCGLLKSYALPVPVAPRAAATDADDDHYRLGDA